jgi:hypothetical protein
MGRAGRKGTAMDDDLKEENRKVRRLRFMVDFALEYIRTQRIDHDHAMLLVGEVKRFALDLFPGKEESFDIIYAPRFKRLLNEKYRRS